MIIELNLFEFISELLFIIGMIFFSKVNSLAGKILIVGILVIWIARKILNRKYSLYDLLMFMVAGLFVGSNYLLYFGIVINSIYICTIAKKGLNMKADLEVIGFAVMLISGVLSSFVNAADKSSAYQYIIVYFLLLLYMWENKIVSRNAVIEENSAVRFFSVSSFMLGIGFFITHTFTDLWSLSRMSIFYNMQEGIGSNTLAGIMAPFFCGCLLIVIESKDKKSIIFSFLAAVLMAPVLLAIQSRGAYLGIFVAALWLLLREKSPRMITFFIGLFLFVLFIRIYNPDIFTRFFGRFSSVVYRTGSSLNGREQLYEIAWRMFRAHPIIGNGFWQFYLNGIPGKDPHNFLLAYLASTGMIGAIGFLVYLVSAYRRLSAAFKNKTGNSKLLCEIAIISFIIFVVHGCVEPSMSTQAPLSIFILITLLPVNLKKSSNESSLS
ncbi:MAG: O-antigen ligase family protein [Lachnospiraceae bacterium]|nr:O-antigen ligase family protein [Lachnospiraceae bacterium]